MFGKTAPLTSDPMLSWMPGGEGTEKRGAGSVLMLISGGVLGGIESVST